MDFTVDRTASEADGTPVFLLRDSQGTSLLRAEQAQGPPPEQRRQIRLSRPSGRVVATIDLPHAEPPAIPAEKRTDYAIIHDFAVYAIISVCRRSDADEGGPTEDYYLLEVEGETWLALPEQQEVGCYMLYDEVPAGLHTYETLTELDLPDSIGRLCRRAEQPAGVSITLSPQRLKHIDLVLLALGLLIDRSEPVS